MLTYALHELQRSNLNQKHEVNHKCNIKLIEWEYILFHLVQTLKTFTSDLFCSLSIVTVRQLLAFKITMTTSVIIRLIHRYNSLAISPYHISHPFKQSIFYLTKEIFIFLCNATTTKRVHGRTLARDHNNILKNNNKTFH